MNTERVHGKVRVAIDLSIIHNPMTFMSTFAVWFIAGYVVAYIFGLVR